MIEGLTGPVPMDESRDYKRPVSNAHHQVMVMISLGGLMEAVMVTLIF